MIEEKLNGIRNKIVVGIVYGALALSGVTLTYGCGSTGSYTPSSSSSSSSGSDHDHGGYDRGDRGNSGGHSSDRSGHCEPRGAH
ncbi:MAG: hypothetical protein WCV90_00765 [Candidatus Woesearchaeota archaeon]